MATVNSAGDVVAAGGGVKKKGKKRHMLDIYDVAYQVSKLYVV